VRAQSKNILIKSRKENAFGKPVEARFSAIQERKKGRKRRREVEIKRKRNVSDDSVGVGG
jgi:hypothetical protein